MNQPEALHIWTVYDHPLDFPDDFVARLFVVGSGPNYGATDRVVTGATLEAVRAQLPRGLHCIDRQPGDDAAVVESWL